MTLSQLDELKRWAADHDVPEGVTTALEYARERAAREACEAARPGNVALLTYLKEPRFEATSYGHPVTSGERASSPTDAYLALLKELVTTSDRPSEIG